jgi:hypothetical protein
MLQRWAWDQFCLNNKVIHKCINVRITLRNCLLQTNYDVGNQELLAVKLALEEWRHWLEGAKEPFVILTNHWNLEYIRTASRLNTLQARWGLAIFPSCRSSGLGCRCGHPPDSEGAHTPELSS